MDAQAALDMSAPGPSSPLTDSAAAPALSGTAFLEEAEGRFRPGIKPSLKSLDPVTSRSSLIYTVLSEELSWFAWSSNICPACSRQR